MFLVCRNKRSCPDSGALESLRHWGRIPKLPTKSLGIVSCLGPWMLGKVSWRAAARVASSIMGPMLGDGLGLSPDQVPGTNRGPPW